MNSHLYLNYKIKKTAVFLFCVPSLLILVSCESRRLKTEAEATRIPETIVGKDGAEMMLIPAGEFQMGSKCYTKYLQDLSRIFPLNYTEPVHTVYVDAFYMDKYPVTNAQFRKFLMANPQWRKGGIFDRRYQHGYYLRDWNGMNYPEGKADYPVIHVSWYVAAAYAQWAGKRLPTEAEWEKAARGGLIGKIYPWGNKLSRDHANYTGTGGRDKWDITAPVASFLPNGYGLYDMAGNVWEWCADEFDLGYYSKSPKNNPKGPGDVITFGTGAFMNVKSRRVLRGGSGDVPISHPYYLRCAFRFNYIGTVPSIGHYFSGFRCAQDP